MDYIRNTVNFRYTSFFFNVTRSVYSRNIWPFQKRISKKDNVTFQNCVIIWNWEPTFLTRFKRQFGSTGTFSFVPRAASSRFNRLFPNWTMKLRPKETKFHHQNSFIKMAEIRFMESKYSRNINFVIWAKFSSLYLTISRFSVNIG